jgi:hypothetical protein
LETWKWPKILGFLNRERRERRETKRAKKLCGTSGTAGENGCTEGNKGNEEGRDLPWAEGGGVPLGGTGGTSVGVWRVIALTFTCAIGFFGQEWKGRSARVARDFFFAGRSGLAFFIQTRSANKGFYFRSCGSAGVGPNSA